MQNNDKKNYMSLFFFPLQCTVKKKGKIPDKRIYYPYDICMQKLNFNATICDESKCLILQTYVQ